MPISSFIYNFCKASKLIYLAGSWVLRNRKFVQTQTVFPDFQHHHALKSYKELREWLSSRSMWVAVLELYGPAG